MSVEKRITINSQEFRHLFVSVYSCLQHFTFSKKLLLLLLLLVVVVVVVVV